MRVCVGGTFDRFHIGHQMLLRMALEIADEIYIGVTSDEMAHGEKHDVEPYKTRAENVIEFVRRSGFRGRVEVVPLYDRYGNAHFDDYDAIVVSEETRQIAEEINVIRAESGLPALKIIAVPIVRADDGGPVSSSRIRRGEIDRDGHAIRRQHPVG